MIPGAPCITVERAEKWMECFAGDARIPAGDDAGHFRGPKDLYATRGFEPVEQREHDTVMRRVGATS